MSGRWGFALLLAATPAWAQLPSPAPLVQQRAAAHGWDVAIFQVDRAGTLVGNPLSFPCTASGCERYETLDVEGKPVQFLMSLTFVPKGAYFSLQSVQTEVRKVVEFEKGFVGPLFLQVKQNQRFNVTLRYTLTGKALTEAQQPGAKLMQNDRSLVFQRKLQPDITLRLSLSPATTAPEAPETKPIDPAAPAAPPKP